MVLLAIAFGLTLGLSAILKLDAKEAALASLAVAALVQIVYIRLVLNSHREDLDRLETTLVSTKESIELFDAIIESSKWLGVPGVSDHRAKLLKQIKGLKRGEVTLSRREEVYDLDILHLRAISKGSYYATAPILEQDIEGQFEVGYFEKLEAEIIAASKRDVNVQRLYILDAADQLNHKSLKVHLDRLVNEGQRIEVKYLDASSLGPRGSKYLDVDLVIFNNERVSRGHVRNDQIDILETTFTSDEKQVDDGKKLWEMLWRHPLSKSYPSELN